MTRFRLLAWLGLGAVLVAGCTVGAGPPVPPLPEDAGSSDQPYPEGPYGVGVGSVIRNYGFTGYVDPSQGVGEARHVPISLGDFYNPTRQGTYPEGSPFGAGTPLPKGLVVNISAVWCVSCKYEAQMVLPEKYAELAPQGGELLLDLAESNAMGHVAGFGELDSWVSTFDVRYPSVIDPSYQLGGLFDSSQFPANIMIDTSDMTVVQSVAGVPEESFWL
jgi:hypothetical protein